MRGGTRSHISGNTRAIAMIGLALLLAPVSLSHAYMAYAADEVTPITDGTGTVDAADIEISGHKDVISVDETLELSVTVLPANATEQTVSYVSSNEKVLTVDSKGQAKGISPGKATVTISAGGLTKRVSIRVREATEYIGVDSDYLVMKVGEVHTIKAKAVPSGASQDITFKSLNPKVAKVAKTGVIKALATGSASILVSNEDMSVGITVIVNKGSAAPGVDGGKSDAQEDSGDGAKDSGEADAEAAAFISEIEDSGRTTFPAAEYPVLTAEMLSAIYSAGAQAELTGEGYSISISGSDIVNTENELSTGISFMKDTDGTGFLLNRGRSLPGRVRLTVTDREIPKKYIYLYSSTKKKYELLDAKEGDSLVLDVGGKYLLTDEKISGFKFNPFIVGVAATAVGAAIIIFIIVKRRYWFW